MSEWLETVVTKIAKQPFCLSDLLSKDALKDERDSLCLDICLLEACRNSTETNYTALVEQLIDRFSVDVQKMYTYSLRDSNNLDSEFSADTSNHYFDTTDYVAAPASPSSIKPEAGINWHQDTLLHIAARNSRHHLVEYLIKKGADVNAVNCCGRTALMLGIGDPLVVKCLIDAGSNLDMQDQLGQTTAMLCVLRQCPDVLGMLLGAGINVGLTDKQGYTVMQHTVRMDNIQCFTALMASETVRLHCDSFLIQFQGKPLFYTPMRNFGSSAIALSLSDSSDYSSPEIRASATVFQKFLGVMGDPSENIATRITVLSILRILDDTKIAYSASTTEYGHHKEVVSTEQLKELLEQMEDATDQEVAAIFQGLFKAQRVMGHGSFYTIHYHLYVADYFKRVNCNQECLLLIERATEMLLKRAEQYQLEPRLVNQFGFSIQSLTFPVMVRVPHSELYTVLFNIASGIVAHLKATVTLHGHAAARQGSISLHSMINTNPHMLGYIVRLLNMCYSEICDGNKNFVDITAFICRQCPPVTVINFQTSTLLHQTLFNHSDNLQLISKVLEWGGDQWINTAGERGNSPLHVAVIKSNTLPEIVSLLLESGAHIDSTNADGIMALELCSSKKHSDILKDYYPLTMKCLAAKTIVANASHIPYNTLNLPKFVKHFIDLHNQHR